MKILYFKGYKWLFSQNQQARTDFLGHRRYEALVKHIKPFLKNIKVKEGQYLAYFCGYRWPLRFLVPWSSGLWIVFSNLIATPPTNLMYFSELHYSHNWQRKVLDRIIQNRQISYFHGGLTSKTNSRNGRSKLFGRQ